MKKIFFISLFLLFTTKAYSQQHSTLWLKIQQIREEKFPETSSILLDTRIPVGKYGNLYATPVIQIDNNPTTNNKIGSLSLSQIAGIDYIKCETEECNIKTAAIYGKASAHGLILVYTKTYTLANPSIASTFKYVFP
jgi:hypothetical protein